MKTDIETLRRLKELHSNYRLEIETCGIKPLSRKIYISHSANFIRWIAGEFEPGAAVKRISNLSDDLQI
ncbi:hypothetical protein ACFP1I_08330 [Dyadobacter subterraneus]|uniref:Uncharacterized protein n=1 Tax=Dyadobacter subterraneus TaxID=2773304 RepID=A0ABR9WEC7_9BACT|nr:hypothetical protein [Dyadobacter subterraneus]MBE9463858.1 hypothetical protein [Dyadobacter subterraneus]